MQYAPVEILNLFCQHLHYLDVVRLSSTCSRLRGKLDKRNHVVWRRLMNETWWPSEKDVEFPVPWQAILKDRLSFLREEGRQFTLLCYTTPTLQDKYMYHKIAPHHSVRQLFRGLSNRNGFTKPFGMEISLPQGRGVVTLYSSTIGRTGGRMSHHLPVEYLGWPKPLETRIFFRGLPNDLHPYMADDRQERKQLAREAREKRAKSHH